MIWMRLSIQREPGDPASHCQAEDQRWTTAGLVPDKVLFAGLSSPGYRQLWEGSIGALI
jgi:hypothetical protein